MSQLDLAVVGGLGWMASPMARHWQPGGAVRVRRVHDRGTPGDRRDRVRLAWREHGATLVTSLGELVGQQGDLDGVFICCGKNGDDLPLIAEVADRLAPRRPDAFICHLSTVSTGFAVAAETFCASRGVTYVNYPLTGGPAGAEQATMLILASGTRALYDRLEPALKALGRPQYIGPRVAAGAEVKLIGHLMVFNGLLGACAAVATHSACFLGGVVGGSPQADFFDVLNTGAGGTRQWDLILAAGIRDGRWEMPFLARYAVVDALYAAQLCLERQLSALTIYPVLLVALAFSYLLNHVDPKLATHAIVRELVAGKASALDAFVAQHAGLLADPQDGINRCVASLPQTIQRTVALRCTPADFAAALQPA